MKPGASHTETVDSADLGILRPYQEVVIINGSLIISLLRHLHGSSDSFDI
jgi:hypothetical protein